MAKISRMTETDTYGPAEDSHPAHAAHRHLDCTEADHVIALLAYNLLTCRPLLSAALFGRARLRGLLR